MGLEAYLWIKNGDAGLTGNIEDANHQHQGWIELKDYVHRLSSNSKTFEIMKKLDNTTPWLAERVMTGAVIDRMLLHAVSDADTLTLYELRNVVLLSTESREDDEEQADQVAAAVQTIAANSAQGDQWAAAPFTSYNVEESADRYELFQAVCAAVKLTSTPRDKAGLNQLTQTILAGGQPAPEFYS